MTIEEVALRFGTLYRACKELDIAPQNMTNWKKHGYIPLKQQFRIAMLTDGDLMPDDFDPKYKRKKTKDD